MAYIGLLLTPLAYSFFFQKFMVNGIRDLDTCYSIRQNFPQVVGRRHVKIPLVLSNIHHVQDLSLGFSLLPSCNYSAVTSLLRCYQGQGSSEQVRRQMEKSPQRRKMKTTLLKEGGWKEEGVGVDKDSFASGEKSMLKELK